MMRKVTALLFLLLLAGCGGESDMVSFETRLASFEPVEGYAERILPGGQKIWVAETTVLTGADTVEAQVMPGPRGPMISVTLNENGRLKFSAATAASVGKPMAMLIDGDLVSAPMVQAPITEPRLLIMGDFDEDEALRIARGVVPAP